MSDIYLVRPKPEHERDARDFAHETMLADDDGIHGSSELNYAPSFAEWLENIANAAAGNPPVHLSAADTFFAIRMSDGQIAGIINIGYALSTDFMRNYGGHIGYTVRPRDRGKGFATQMLRLALARCRELRIERVLLTVEPENIASCRAIERCGGVFECEIPFLDTDEMVRRYWIDLCGND